MFPDLIRTARLVIRPITAADAPLIFEAYTQDPVVTRFLTWRPHVHLEEAGAYIARCQATTASRTYVLTGRDGQAVLGALDLRRAVRYHLDFGYVLARHAWGQGLMTEALTAAVDWALGEPGIWRVGGVCDVDNLASARVMLKAGLTQEGLLRRWLVHPNVSEQPRNCLIFAKVR